MKIVFDHKFGVQEKQHLEHYSATLVDVQDDISTKHWKQVG